MRISLLINEEDKPYLARIKKYLAKHDVVCRIPPPNSIMTMYQITTGFDAVMTTRTDVLAKLITRDSKPVISNYEGSLFTTATGVEVLILPPIKQAISINYGEFLIARYISKITLPQQWYNPPTAFKWSVINSQADFLVAFRAVTAAPLVAIDIETSRAHGIYCLCFTTPVHSYVLPITSMEQVYQMRKLCATPSYKVLQNGKYDNNYLMAYGAPVTGYLLDTINIMHSWYSELPKDLASINSFLLRNSMFWKDMSDGDLMDKYHYNALDGWNTIHSTISALQSWPAWAKKNFQMEFPQVYPALHCELIGIHRDMDKLTKVNEDLEAKIASKQASLEAMVVKGFNPNSHLQVKKLMVAMGCRDIADSSDEKHLIKASLRHPLANRLFSLILDIRGLRKLVSTYLPVGDKAKEFKGKILYSLNPHGTETGRYASSEHAFWCGLQLQNIPRGKETKSTLRAPVGWVMAEADYAQVESRCTAYISGDVTLIDNVEHSPDFHSSNASGFFGVPFDQIYDIAKDKVINKPLRTLAKPVNHGANYNMGPAVLIDTMGITKMWEAKALLKLPAHYELMDVANHLLASFHNLYPGLRKTYYPRVILDVMTKHKLVGATGWTRYCFGNPKENKPDLNSYIAHGPQSLNAMNLNKAFLKVWLKVALPNPTTFKLLGQIHDSIPHFCKIGHEHHMQEVVAIMEEESTTTITACTGVTYTFKAPADLKAGKDGKGVTYWSDTE